MKRLSFKGRIILWFILAALLLSFSAAVVYKSFTRFGEQSQWVIHTYEVINRLETVVSGLKDVQLSQRGYLITGQDEYLLPYYAALPQIEENYVRLVELVTDNPVQESRLKLLRTEIDARLVTTKNILNVFEQSGQEAVFALVKTGTGKREMDEIRTLVNTMVADENQLLSMRLQAGKDASRMTLNLGKIGLVIFMSIFTLVFWSIRKETAKREETELSLKDALDDMQRSTDDARAVSSMIDYLQSSQDTEEAYGIMAYALPHILKDTNGALFIYNENRNFLEQVATWGDYQGAKEMTPEQCWALRRGRPHQVLPGGSEPVCAHSGEHQQDSDVSVCFPMQAQGDSIGLFYLQSDSVSSLDIRRRTLAHQISEQISLALSNLRLQSKLKNQSIRDPLTGLFNRRYLEETMQRELSRSKRKKEPLSILVLDIDHFKKYNDTMGHDAGDALLVHFTALLQQNTRKEDIVCRYGGEEFVVVLPSTAQETAWHLAEKFRLLVKEMQVTFNKTKIDGITVSIGVATFPEHGGTSADLISKADTALYFAKNNGRDQVAIAQNDV